MEQASSLSGRSPLIPIEPTTFPSFRIKTPPATGAMRPAEMELRAAQNVGVSIARFAIARPPIPIPTGPQALAKAISGLNTPLPSSRFRTMAAPPASTTATVIGLQFSSRAFANAACTMASASCNVNPHISLPPNRDLEKRPELRYTGRPPKFQSTISYPLSVSNEFSRLDYRVTFPAFALDTVSCNAIRQATDLQIGNNGQDNSHGQRLSRIKPSKNNELVESVNNNC